jgi:4-diphosphocytidyl-2-C-methyl-D-erythritol kinase
MRIGAKLGADVPACVASRPCIMRGTGEEVAPIALPELAAVLVNPGVPTPTGPVYRAFDALGAGAGFARQEAPVWQDAAAALAGLQAMRNDLTDAAVTVCPPIADARGALGAAGESRLARLSGSGATVFALTADGAQAGRLAGRLAIPGWWTAAVRLARVDLNVSPR